jgi:hypothetical protein
MNTPNDPQNPPPPPHDPYTAPERTPDPALSPPRPPGAPRPVRRPPSSEARGSIGLGIGLAWACLIGGYTVFGFLIAAVYAVLPHEAQDTVAILLALLPWVMMIALIVWMASSGQSRTASGIGLGIASIFGVALLLVAACFGLFASGGFH